MIELHVLSRDDLATRRNGQWSDLDATASLSEEKRRALLTNPDAAEAETPCRIVATQGDRIVGHLDILAGNLEVGERSVRCLWGSALYASGGTDSAGVGLLLLLKFQELNDTVGACGVSQAAYPIYKRLRWIDCSLPRFVLPIRTRPMLRRYLGRDWLAAISAPVLDAAIAGSRTASWRALGRPARHFRVESVGELPHELDAKLSSTQSSVTGRRSGRRFRWLLDNTFDSSRESCRALCLVHGPAREAVGYFLVKARRYEVASQRRIPNLVLGSIQDWAVFDPQRVEPEQLLMLAARELLGWGVDAVEVCVPRHEGLRLGRYGFIAAGALHVLMKARPPSILSEPRYQRPESWMLRPAEGDNFFS